MAFTKQSTSDMKYSGRKQRVVQVKKVKAKMKPKRSAAQNYKKKVGRYHPCVKTYEARGEIKIFRILDLPPEILDLVIAHMVIRPSGIYPFAQRYQDTTTYLAKRALHPNPFLPTLLISKYFHKIGVKAAYENNVFKFNDMEGLGHFVRPTQYDNNIAAPATRNLIKNIELILDGATDAKAAREVYSFIVPAEYSFLKIRAPTSQMALDMMFSCVPAVKHLLIRVSLWPNDPDSVITNHEELAAKGISDGRTPMRFVLEYPNPGLVTVEGGKVEKKKPLLSKPLRRLLLPAPIAEFFFWYLLKIVWDSRIRLLEESDLFHSTDEDRESEEEDRGNEDRGNEDQEFDSEDSDREDSDGENSVEDGEGSDDESG